MAVGDFVGERHLRRLADTQVLIALTRIERIRTVRVDGQTRHRVTRLGVAQVIAIDIRGVKLAGDGCAVFGRRNRFIGSNRAIVRSGNSDGSCRRIRAALPIGNRVGDLDILRFTHTKGVKTITGREGNCSVRIDDNRPVNTIRQSRPRYTEGIAIRVGIICENIDGDRSIFTRCRRIRKSLRAIITAFHRNGGRRRIRAAPAIGNGVGDYDILRFTHTKGVKPIAGCEGNRSVRIDDNRPVNTIRQGRAGNTEDIAINIRIIGKNVNGNAAAFIRRGCVIRRNGAIVDFIDTHVEPVQRRAAIAGCGQRRQGHITRVILRRRNGQLTQISRLHCPRTVAIIRSGIQYSAIRHASNDHVDNGFNGARVLICRNIERNSRVFTPGHICDAKIGRIELRRNRHTQCLGGGNGGSTACLGRRRGNRQIDIAIEILRRRHGQTIELIGDADQSPAFIRIGGNGPRPIGILGTIRQHGAIGNIGNGDAQRLVAAVQIIQDGVNIQRNRRIFRTDDRCH